MGMRACVQPSQPLSVRSCTRTLTARAGLQAPRTVTQTGLATATATRLASIPSADGTRWTCAPEPWTALAFAVQCSSS
eukprot:4657832-Prymnesium_polylepis.2